MEDYGSSYSEKPFRPCKSRRFLGQAWGSHSRRPTAGISASRTGVCLEATFRWTPIQHTKVDRSNLSEKIYKLVNLANQVHFRAFGELSGFFIFSTRGAAASQFPLTDPVQRGQLAVGTQTAPRSQQSPQHLRGVVRGGPTPGLPLRPSRLKMLKYFNPSGLQASGSRVHRVSEFSDTFELTG